MSDSLAGRILLAGATLLLISMALYGSLRLLPGSPSWAEEAGSRPSAASWLARQHVDDPIPIAWARWVGDLLRLDLGSSLSVQPGRPVTDLIAAALPWTLLLGTLSLLVALGVALPVGGLSAAFPDSFLARVLAALLYLLHALPVFLVAILLQQGVAGRLRLLPGLGPGPSTPDGRPLSALASLAWGAHWILPVLSLALGSLAFVVRFVRSSLLQGMAERWSAAARARGASRGWILARHAARHTALPVVTLLGLVLPGVLGGSVLIESVFALPGMGRLFFTAIARRDYPVVMSCALLVAAATLAAGLLTEAAHRRLDPRMRAAKRSGAVR